MLRHRIIREKSAMHNNIKQATYQQTEKKVHNQHQVQRLKMSSCIAIGVVYVTVKYKQFLLVL